MLDCEDDSVEDISLRPSSHLSAGDGQNFIVRCDWSVAMKVHQVLQKLVMLLLSHDDVMAVLRHVDHEMPTADLSSGGQGGDKKRGSMRVVGVSAVTGTRFQ